jgi:hypothetical protein
MPQPKYRVIFRTCDAVLSVHGAPRPFGLTKTRLAKLCFLSLYDAIKNYDCSIHILGDKLSDDIQAFFNRFTAQDERVTLSNAVMGNEESIRQSVRYALQFHDDDWIYFCEDDYLHQPYAFLWIDDLIQNRMDILNYVPRRAWMKIFIDQLNNKPLFIHPPDYPDRYKAAQRKHSFLFLSKYCHWRQVSHATYSFLGEVKSIKKYQAAMLKSADNADDGYLSRRLFGRLLFLGRGLCVSPIPALSTHLQVNEMSPLVDWHQLYERCDAKLTEFETASRL